MANYTEENVRDILNRAYPPGSYYETDTDSNPSTLFGGTWIKIEDVFLKPTGNNTKSGSNTKTLSDVPYHRHDTSSHRHTISSHTHSVSSTSHNHTATVSSHNHTVSRSSHTHSVTIYRGGTRSYGVPWSGSGSMYARNNSVDSTYTITTANCTTTPTQTSGSPSWSSFGSSSDSGATTSITPSISSASPTVSSVGSGSAINIVPPSRQCYIWWRES